MLQGLRLVPSALLHRLHDTCLESADLTFDRCPAKGFPCPVPVQGCTSLRRHLLTLLADLPSSLVMEDQGEVCPLSRRVMSPPYPNRYSLAFAFSPILYPHGHRPALQRDYPLGSSTGLPCSACVTGMG